MSAKMDPVVAQLVQTYMQKMIATRANGVSASRKAPKSDKRTVLVSTVRDMLELYAEFQKAISPAVLGKRVGSVDAQMNVFEMVMRTVLSNPFYKLMSSEAYKEAVYGRIVHYDTFLAYYKRPSDQMRHDVRFINWCRARVSGACRYFHGDSGSQCGWTGRVIVPPQRYGW